MSRKKVCKFLWIMNSETKEVITPKRFSKEIGSLGGRVKEGKKNHFDDELSEKLRSKIEEIQPLDLNENQKSMIYSYTLDLPTKEYNEVLAELIENNQKREKRPFDNFASQNINEESFFEQELFCGTAKEELLKIKTILNKGECL